MLRRQARPRGTRARLEHVHVDMNKANQLLRTFAQLNWTTSLVALCEIRQARGTTAEQNADFDRIVLTVRACSPAQRMALGNAVAKIVEEGAQHHCYCVRLFDVLRVWFPEVPAGHWRQGVEPEPSEEGQQFDVYSPVGMACPVQQIAMHSEHAMLVADVEFQEEDMNDKLADVVTELAFPLIGTGSVEELNCGGMPITL